MLSDGKPAEAHRYVDPIQPQLIEDRAVERLRFQSGHIAKNYRKCVANLPLRRFLLLRRVAHLGS